MRSSAARSCHESLLVFAAALIGYLIGGWNTVALRTNERSASDTVALRFPQEWNAAAPAASFAAVVKSSRPATTTASTANDAQLTLLSPQPMIPQANPQASPQAAPQATQAAAAQAPVQIAAAEEAVASSAPDTNEPPQVLQPAQAIQPAPRPASVTKTAERRRIVNRPGYMLDDAQIASIKERLELTPDQERHVAGGRSGAAQYRLYAHQGAGRTRRAVGRHAGCRGRSRTPCKTSNPPPRR